MRVQASQGNGDSMHPATTIRTPIRANSCYQILMSVLTIQHLLSCRHNVHSSNEILKYFIRAMHIGF